MTQVNLERHPFAKHTFYRGEYTHNNLGYSFTLTVEESINSAQPAIIVEFNLPARLRPFDYGKAKKEILSIYLPKQNEDNN